MRQSRGVFVERFHIFVYTFRFEIEYGMVFCGDMFMVIDNLFSGGFMGFYLGGVVNDG